MMSTAINFAGKLARTGGAGGVMTAADDVWI
jgi:hypothetical protein